MTIRRFLPVTAAAFLLAWGISALAAPLPGPSAQKPAAAAVSPASTAPAAPAIKTPWTAEDILLAESASGWEISPDGRWAVWVRSAMDKEKAGRVSNLALTDLATGREIPLTRGTDGNDGPRWSPDGRSIAFLSTRPLPKPNPDASRSQLWRIDPFGGEPEPLTSFVRGVRRFAWTASGAIVFSAQEDPSLVEQDRKKDKDTTIVVDDVDHEPPVRLFRIDLPARKTVRLTGNADFIQAWDVTPDGKTAVAVHGQYLSYEWDQRIRPKLMRWNLETGEGREICAADRLAPTDVVASRDGAGFYLAAPYSTHPQFLTASVLLLHYYDLASDRRLAVDLSWEWGLAGSVAALPDGFAALLADGIRLRPARYVRKGDAWSRRDLEGPHVRNTFNFAVSRDGRTVAYEYSTASTPPQWFRASLDGARLGEPLRLTKLNPGFAAKTPARTEILTWTGALGEAVDGLLYYPRDYTEGVRYPLLTAPHGGPAGADMDQWDESWSYAHQLIAQRGAFILKPNYHGSSNYGLKFVESIAAGKYYEYPVEDIQKGVDLVVSRGLADPARIGTFGWSNGSILSIQLSVTDPDRYKVVAAGAGDVEWVSDWANVDFGQAFDTYYFGKSPLQDPQLYMSLSPLYKLDRVKAPTLIFFGTEDRNVPTSQGWTHYRALYHLGKVPVRFVLFPGEPHGLREFAHQKRKLDEEGAWLDRYLFKGETAANEALKKDSPLGQALRRRSVAMAGLRYGILRGTKPGVDAAEAGSAAAGAAAAREILVPEVVKRGALEIGRFEVTRAQFASFDPSVPVPPGAENKPATGIAFERARAYADWLSRATGETWRLPNEDEVASLLEPAAGENTLDWWAGYAANPDDAGRLRAKIAELGGDAPLLKDVGSFPGTGKDEEELVFDLGGNAAEWVVAKGGAGKALGGSADRPADSKATAAPSPAYTGFRLVRGAPAPAASTVAAPAAKSAPPARKR